MTTIRWWRALPDGVQVAITTGSLLAVVWTSGWAMRGRADEHANLPERVSELEAQTKRHAEELQTIEGHLGRIQCYVEALAEVRHVTECMR